jgi:hypothetical protein
MASYDGGIKYPLAWDTALDAFNPPIKVPASFVRHILVQLRNHYTDKSEDARNLDDVNILLIDDLFTGNKTVAIKKHTHYNNPTLDVMTFAHAEYKTKGDRQDCVEASRMLLDDLWNDVMAIYFGDIKYPYDWDTVSPSLLTITPSAPRPPARR